MMYWLIVERKENWQADKASGFRTFGVPARRQKTAQRVRQGDTLITYISTGVSRFSDTRAVEADSLLPPDPSIGYDDVFPFAIATRPLVVLDPDDWIPVTDVLDNLSITRHAKDWRSVMRTTIRSLPEADGQLLSELVARAGATKSGNQ